MSTRVWVAVPLRSPSVTAAAAQVLRALKALDEAGFPQP